MPPAMASAPSSSGPVEAPVKTLTWNFCPRKVAVGDAMGQLHRNRLRISRSCKAAHANLIAGVNQSRSLLRAHDLLL